MKKMGKNPQFVENKGGMEEGKREKWGNGRGRNGALDIGCPFFHSSLFHSSVFPTSPTPPSSYHNNDSVVRARRVAA